MARMANIERAQLSLEEQFLEFLPSLPSLEILRLERGNKVGAGLSPDLVLTLDVKGAPLEIWVEIKTGEVHPKMALEAVDPLIGDDHNVVLVASSLSLESREILRRNGIGYWDRSGSLFLELPNALYSIERDPIPQPRSGRVPRNVFKGKTTQVLHSLLLSPERDWKVTDLAEESGVSAYTSQKVLEFLESKLWVSREGRGPQSVRRLKEPGKLLDAWATEYEGESTDEVRLHQYAQEPQVQMRQLETLMERAGKPWAVTLEHGANYYASVMTRLPSSLTLWVSSARWESLAREAGYRVVDRGENLRLMVSKENCPFLGTQDFDGLKVASPIQLYLDLIRWPRRGREQAEHLRREIIRF